MSRFPALYDSASKKLYPLRGFDSFLVGRNETANVVLQDRTCSRHHFRILHYQGRYYVEALSPTNATYCNDQPVPVTQPLMLQHEAVLQAGSARFRFLERAPGASGKAVRPVPEPPAQAPPKAMPDHLETLFVDPKASIPGGGPMPLGDVRIPVAGKMAIGREQARVQVYLPHPHVSRLHAHLTVQPSGKVVLRDLNSANGTFVNGKRLTRPVALKPGDQIDVGPYALEFTGTELLSRSRSDNIELVARNLRRVVNSRETGKPITLLDDVTLVIKPREFVCLLGPSGSGKSTLLSALSGRMTPDDGVVLVNGKEVLTHFEALKQDMAVVPQKDLLHESLKVGEALWYTARLRLPPDTSYRETRTCIDQILDTVNLKTRRGTAIRYLSGGQVKRASLANEILCRPSLLFLDEVTSGLDEQTDRDMMGLFRSLADSGKTVVCITHSLANVERNCHLVVILANGGRLAFVGRPDEALEYFNIERLGDVYERLAEEQPEHWRDTFKASPYYNTYVQSRLPAPEKETDAIVEQPPHSLLENMGLFVRQTSLLTRRYLAIWRGDYLALLAILGQSLVVAALLGLLFGDLRKLKDSDPIVHAQHAVNLLFLMAVSSFWFGCNNAAKEIVKERAIAARERDFNVQLSSYYMSKLLVLLLFSSVQTVLLFVLVHSWCGPPGPERAECGLLLALAATGVTLGLAISALAPTEEMAATLIPMVIIPQIILSGVIAPLKDLSEKLAMGLITTYWGTRGLDALLPEAVAKVIGLKQESARDAALVLAGHALVFVLIALLCLWLQGRRSKGRGRVRR